MQALYALATKEFEDHWRNGWIVALALAFAVFSAVISLAGFGLTGQVGVADTQTAIISLTSLVIYLIPLMGLLLGVDGIVGERAHGTLDLLRSYPVTTGQIILGKLLGLEAVLVTTLVVGLLPPALLVVLQGGAWLPWSVFLLLASLLGLVFLALALLVSVGAREQGTALGIAVALWLVLVILFDIGLVGLLVATQGNLPETVVEGLFYLNPTSLYRLVSFSLLLDAGALQEMGLGGATMPLWAVTLALTLWGLVPLGLAAWWLRRRE